MSLILEALKKSEQQRRLGEAPTLGSPVHAVRRRRSLLPVVGALAVIALGVGWWLSRSSTETPASPAAPQAAATKPAAPPADARGVAAGPGRKPAPHFTTPATPAAPPVAAAAQGPATARMGNTVQNPQRNDRVAANANAATAAGTPPRPLAAPADAKPDTTNPAVADAKAPGAAPATPAAAPNAAAAPAPAAAATANATAATPAPAATPNTAAATPAPRAAAPAAAQPALPSVWELPYATRKDIPELAITMHVYAGDPSDRFVVIKGERHIEGDDLGDGLTLKEIRADGMVLEYKGQRFVYPRDGR
jgi:general secretion pathway protein B